MVWVSMRVLVGAIAMGRQINGAMEDLLFPIHHGILWDPGMNVLPPFVVYQANRLTVEQYDVVARAYQQRLENLFDRSLIPYRSQNGGHYDDRQVLKLEFRSKRSGLQLHLPTNEQIVFQQMA